MFYQPDRNRYRLETTDKFLKASITIMQSNPLHAFQCSAMDV